MMDDLVVKIQEKLRKNQERINTMQSEQVYAEIKKTSESDFEMLYVEAKKVVKGYVRKVYPTLDADEVYIDFSVEKLPKTIIKYDPSKGISYRSYLKRAANNMIIDCWRKEKERGNKTISSDNGNLLLELEMVRKNLIKVEDKVMEKEYGAIIIKYLKIVFDDLHRSRFGEEAILAFHGKTLSYEDSGDSFYTILLKWRGKTLCIVSILAESNYIDKLNAETEFLTGFKERLVQKNLAEELFLAEFDFESDEGKGKSKVKLNKWVSNISIRIREKHSDYSKEIVNSIYE